jgi:aryl-alcohol dehydrogenase-like predicted oxidoreductase
MVLVRLETTFACMKAAYDVGINFFDCAEGYSGGDSERAMGKAIKKFAWKRNDIVISTKVYKYIEYLASPMTYTCKDLLGSGKRR